MRPHSRSRQRHSPQEAGSAASGVQQDPATIPTEPVLRSRRFLRTLIIAPCLVSQPAGATTGPLFTFLEHEGVEPTNNSAERALRTGVQWRKICFGNRSANGEIATARLLTLAETCDLQRLNIPAYLSAAIACHRKRTGGLAPVRIGIHTHLNCYLFFL